MNNKPITSRIKRSPLLKYSPLKSDKDPKATTGGTIKGKDKKEIKKTKKKKNYPTDRQVCHPDYKARTGKGGPGSKECNAWKNTSDEQKRRAETEIVEEEIITPGEDLDYDTTLYKQKMGDVLQPWETRQMSRAIKKEQRDIRRAKQKLERAQKRGNTIKAEEAQAELDEFQEMAKRGKAARATGRRTGTTNVQTGQEQMLKGDQTKEEQREEALREARREARARAQQVTTGTSQAEGAINVGDSSNAFQINPAVYNLDFLTGDYSNLLNKPSPANMKSSPAKKALKGNQYKLPQHLQKAIKAAPGKLKTPLKKGYFKNK